MRSILAVAHAKAFADAHGDVPRWEALKEALASARDQFADLAESWDLKLYRFDEEVHAAGVADEVACGDDHAGRVTHPARRRAVRDPSVESAAPATEPREVARCPSQIVDDELQAQRLTAQALHG